MAGATTMAPRRDWSIRALQHRRDHAGPGHLGRGDRRVHMGARAGGQSATHRSLRQPRHPGAAVGGERRDRRHRLVRGPGRRRRAPRPIPTPPIEMLFAGDAAWQKRPNRIPPGRFGRGDDVAWAGIYPASEESAWTTGTALVVDGGVTVDDGSRWRPATRWGSPPTGVRPPPATRSARRSHPSLSRSVLRPPRPPAGVARRRTTRRRPVHPRPAGRRRGTARCAG